MRYKFDSTSLYLVRDASDREPISVTLFDSDIALCDVTAMLSFYHKHAYDSIFTP
jgi:hypothetical protein